MKHQIENGTITIFLKGELNSYNSEEAEGQIDEILGKGGFTAVRLDFGEVAYISSAGLRIIVRIKQRFADTALLNVPDGVYDVLTMVGFQNLFQIERK